jgi:ataxia telangiectasia mutated family protein
MTLLMPYFVDANVAHVQIIEKDLPDLAEQLLQFLDDAALRDSREAHKLNETLLQSLHPYLPSCDSAEFRQLSETRNHLLRFLVSVSDNLTRRHILPADLASQGSGLDKMDIDYKSLKREDDVSIARQKTVMPRRDLALDTWSGSFYQVAIGRLAMVATANNAPKSVEFVPSAFVDYFLGLSIEDLLSSRRLLQEIILSDLILNDADAGRILEHLGEMISSKEFERCEVALQTCLDVMAGTWSFWSDPNGSDASEAAAQIYEWFIGTALENDLASPVVQKSISGLLLLLLRKNREYGVVKGLTSPRSSLLNLLQKGNASVKFYIGEHLSQIFNLFILKDHDTVFLDIQNNLPKDPDWLEGIFFRLFVFAKLASTWPNLLRRCIYHIFETAGKLSDCIDHASQCLVDIARDLEVDGPRELFTLFAPQILFTWLEYEEIESIPFRIFGFPTLRELLEHAQEEATALMVMRGQDDSVDRISSVLEIKTDELLRQSFTKVVAYTIAHDTSTPPSSSNKSTTGEARVKKRLGRDAFFECVHLHFADIIAVFYNLIERESELEKYFARDETYIYAAKTMQKIKAMSSSDAVLPANQQPTFRARYLTANIQHLCSRTQYEMKSLYTPPLVLSIARQLLNTIHPALGSLHACSVIRKLRVLICLAGESVTSGYPLEMLLQSVRPYITDTECADDAIGIMQYLIHVGSVYLSQTPSFIAGISVAVLGSLRVFLESHKASTTQESQHKMTMTKAQKFHVWMGDYLSNYSSPALSSHLKPKFQALIQYAFNLRSIGNADSGSPESQLLLQLFEDEKAGGSLLSRPARKLSLQMLSAEFRAPSTFRDDALGNDDLSKSYAEVIWRSCQDSKSREYLCWAAKVLGRAFASSGHVYEELLRESTLFQARELSASSGEVVDSATCILQLLLELVLGYDPRTTGLAEIALREIMSNSDDALAIIAQKSLPDSLQYASMWQPYQIPPSEQLSRTKVAAKVPDLKRAVLSTDAISQEHWLRDLSIVVAESVPNDPVLGALVPILWEVLGFAERAFPFILHLVLSASPKDQQISKQKLSHAFSGWFTESETVNKINLRMLLNSILYLRTQPLPGEKSSADRARWLEIDYLKAAAAAARCGMFKTSLLFVEEYCSQPSKSSRRSSAMNLGEQVEMPTELLLAIFENVDDPDMYYGVQQSPNLNTILARLEYEKDGPKSLAFRGARYDSHVRRHDPESVQDVRSLVRALNVLNQNGLSHSLLQAQQTAGMTPQSLESMFQTARKLEQWDIPVPSTCASNAVTIYKAFQAVDLAESKFSIVQAVNEGLEYTMRSLTQDDLSSAALHGSLQTLAALVEIDEILAGGSERFEEMLSRFRSRSEWMKVGQ